MADNIIEEQPTQEQIQDANAAELKQQMAISLGLPIPNQEEVQAVELTEVPRETDGGNVTEDQVVEAPAFTFDTFKEKFGYEKPEDIVAEIEQLRALKNTPTAAEVKFENEQSKKLYDAIVSGKQKEAYLILNEQERLDALVSQEVTKDNAADFIKAGMQNKYKDLTPEQINYKFNKQFGVPKEPVQTDVEDDDDFAKRHNEWKSQVADAEMDRIIEAKLIKPELEVAKVKLVLPDIGAPVDEEYLQYKKMLEEEKSIEAETIKDYEKLKPSDVVIPFDFIDEANKITLKSSFTPDAESFSKTMEGLLDDAKYYAKYKNSDGSPNRKKYLADRYIADNWTKILSEAMKQVKNATLKAQLPDNSTGGLSRQLPQEQQMSELDTLMKWSLGGTRG